MRRFVNRMGLLFEGLSTRRLSLALVVALGLITPWAIGPRIGGYAGVDITRPKTFNFQLGLHPYFTPLFSVGDSGNHRGRAAGITVAGSFRFHTNKVKERSK